MPPELAELRAQQVKPQWAYLDQCLALVKQVLGDAKVPPRLPKILSPDPGDIDALLRTLTPDDRAEILAVAGYEIGMLLFWCRMQAETRTRRRACGLS